MLGCLALTIEILNESRDLHESYVYLLRLPAPNNPLPSRPNDYQAPNNPLPQATFQNCDTNTSPTVAYPRWEEIMTHTPCGNGVNTIYVTLESIDGPGGFSLGSGPRGVNEGCLVRMGCAPATRGVP